MIVQNTIRSTLPNPTLEPELYSKVSSLQIHTCNSKCGGPTLPNSRCKKGFSRPFAEHTYYDSSNYRYTYQCLTPRDQWVVPYHAPTLITWSAHMNAQYITN